MDAWRDAVVAFDDDEDEDFELFLDDLDGDLEETPPPRDDAPRYLREAVEVCGADAALEGLTARERDVLEARYWSEAPRTQLDAANELDVSLTRVNNLERSARKKLERLLEERRSMAQTDADVSDDDGLSDAAQRALAEGRLMLGVMERRVGYFYFRDELGLDEATLGRLLAHHGAVLSQRRDTLAEKGASLRRHLNLDESELKKLIRVQPTLLGHNATQLRRKIEWLRTACDCAHERELGQACLKCPPLLATSARRVLAPAITQLRALDPSGALARRILEQHPNALRARDVGARLKALADAVDGDAQDAARMAWKEPRALAIDARSLDERAAALRQALGEREANALIGKRPDVLLASTSKLSDVAAALEAVARPDARERDAPRGSRRVDGAARRRVDGVGQSAPAGDVPLQGARALSRKSRGGRLPPAAVPGAVRREEPPAGLRLAGVGAARWFREGRLAAGDRRGQTRRAAESGRRLPDGARAVGREKPQTQAPRAPDGAQAERAARPGQAPARARRRRRGGVAVPGAPRLLARRAPAAAAAAHPPGGIAPGGHRDAAQCPEAQFEKRLQGRLAHP